MRIRASVITLFFFAAIGLQAQQNFKADFDFLWTEIDKNYAYFERQGTDWDAVKQHYRPLTDTVSHPYYFTLFLENVLRELADSHTHLRTNTDRSQRLIPSGTDLKVGFAGQKLLVLQTRMGSKASELLSPGDEIIAINGQKPREAVSHFFGQFMNRNAMDIHLFTAANICVAGDYRSNRVFKVKREDKTFEIDLGVYQFPKEDQDLISSKMMAGNVGYIRIENSLGNTTLITEFDAALNNLMSTKALILDLRNTPSGGDSVVGMPILARFTAAPKPYQIHYRPSENKRWTEVVQPRGSTYDKPVYVLINFWTGSMGEGMTIGLDAFGNSTTIGTTMAGLLGANYTVNLPNSNYGLNITFEQLFHVDGTPREEYNPDVFLSSEELQSQDDPWLEKAMELLNK